MTDTRLHTLTGEECRRMLATRSLGRLGVVRGGFPLIVPVNYAVDRDRIVVHTNAGMKLSAARERRVTFEVDQIDESARTGWSVLVQGFALEISPDDPDHDRLAALPVPVWAPGERDRLLLITPISVTGRCIA